MKQFIILLAAAATSIGLAGAALAQEYTDGEIKKVDSDQKKITIKHGELKNLDMPPMTMVFAAGDDAMLKKAKPGQKIQFKADRVNGKLTVTEIK